MRAKAFAGGSRSAEPVGRGTGLAVEGRRGAGEGGGAAKQRRFGRGLGPGQHRHGGCGWGRRCRRAFRAGQQGVEFGENVGADVGGQGLDARRVPGDHAQGGEEFRQADRLIVAVAFAF
ncbi:MAG: hypothetical protein ACK56I_21270, partial [bacterium]